jgi:NADPH-dependent 2,4-dienoyl-CoA reductase/sulfur reductase-like enzyme
MPHYKYLIVGGGMAAAAAVKGIRKLDAEGSIGILGRDPDPPYARPPLSKGLWKGEQLEKIWLGAEEKGAVFHGGRTAQRLDVQGHRVTDDRGEEFGFEKVLLATGGTPKRLPGAPDSVIHYRTLDDYRRLRELADRGQRFVVVGNGFIGSEIAAALAMNGKRVVMVFPAEAIGSRIYPPGLARFLNEYYRDKGVELRSGDTVTGVEEQAGKLAVATKAGWRDLADGVVVGIGIEPNTELAKQAGVEVKDGIVVDELTRAGHPDVHAAGDAASFHSPALEKRIRVEHEDNALTMGRHAGRVMAGDEKPYHHLPMFYSDLFDLGYEAVGELDSRLEIVEDWKEPNRQGVVYYLKSGRVRGVLLWNVWEQVENARKLIAEPGPFRPADLKGRLPA